MLSSALFTFNDTAVINARGALRIAELQVPGDISIIGFNDIQASSGNPLRLWITSETDWSVTGSFMIQFRPKTKLPRI
jgi:hypothetical protein